MWSVVHVKVAVKARKLVPHPEHRPDLFFFRKLFPLSDDVLQDVRALQMRPSVSDQRYERLIL